MKGDVFRLFGLMALVAVVGSGVVLLGPKCLSAAAGPEGGLVAMLKEAEGKGFTVPGPLPLKIDKASFDRLSVRLPAPGVAVVDATLDCEGHAGATQVSSLGVEQVAFEVRDGDWVAPSLAPRLGQVVEALELRRQTLERDGLPDGGDWPGSALERRRLSAQAWFIRLERKGAEVTERYRLQGDTPERPVDLVAEKRLSLERRDSGFFFPEGLW